MLNKQLFILAHEIVSPSFYSSYKKLCKSQWESYEVLKREQEKQLGYLIRYSYEQVPYYRSLFKKLNLLPGDIRRIEDLEKLPILTKDIIKNRWDDFIPTNLSSIKYYDQVTGGSTGTPTPYRLSKHDRFLGGALLYRGWGYGGFELGDKMVFLAGSSLDVGKNSYLVTKAHEIARNIRKMSSFEMGEPEMREYTKLVNIFRPLFIRGYASAIYFFAGWLERNQVLIHSPKGIFTTAEKLFPHMRDTIGRVFECEVFDGYGLNDGGVGAYECSEHNGLHIDTERSIMEIVDQHGFQIKEGKGQILATSLHNYAMPFIRFNTDDVGFLSNEGCSCGRKTQMLKEILGKQHEMLRTPDGKHVHGAYINQLFLPIPHVKEFQVIQQRVDKLTFFIVPEPNFDENRLDCIREEMATKGWNVEFRFVDSIDRTRAGKYKYIVNKIEP